MTVAGLRELGHDVKDVRGTGQQGLPDANLWTLGLAEERMLITTDKGFTEFIQSSPPGTSAIMYRNRSRPRADFLRRVARAATTMACDCSPSSRSLNGSSCARKSSMLVHTSSVSVAPVNRKRSRSYTIAILSSSSYLD